MHRTARAGTIARGRQDPSGGIRATLGGALVAGLLTLVPTAIAGAETPPGSSPESARLGNIELDRQARSFRVPGTLARLDPPLEYLAVSRGGIKAYESLLELDVGGAELNAACILVGMEAIAGGQPEFQFDPDAIEGSPVGLAIGWEGETGPVEVPAGRLLSSEGREVGEQPWAYIGSQFAPDGRYLAQDSGTLIGFVHDPISVIEHRDGLGIGAYGSVGGNAALAPPPGTRVWLRVTNLGAGLSAATPAAD